jgi:methionyl-tRNA formyltransferase
MRVAFFGTPAFAVPSFSALVGADVDVVAAVTGPDRPRTRSHSTLLPAPVTAAARAAGVPLLQPERPRGEAFLGQIRALDLDLAVVVAYGHLLRPELLRIPRLGFVNVHASLLPRWRGAAPIHWAVLSGDCETGVSIMQLDAGLDTGALWHQVRVPIADQDTTGDLFERLGTLGAQALLDALPLIAADRPPTPQDTTAVTHAPKVDRSTARVDWSRPARTVSCLIRAMDPAPGAWTVHAGQDLKLFGPRETAGEPGAPPGRLIGAPDRVRVSCGDGSALELAEVQPAGRRRMTGGDWLRGLDPATDRALQ